MHSLISFNNLQFNIDDKTILNNISGSISTSDKIGLVGNNGAGKTTLLKLISKMDEPTSGRVISDSRIAFVKQFEIDKNNSTQTVFEYIQIQSFEDWWKILDTYELIFKTRLDPETKLKDLSGGELTKINIASAFCLNPELLLLDEPTNHLDITSISNLTIFINNYSGAFLIASHDIDFLNSIVTKIWEIKEGKLRIFGGNYDDYKNTLRLEHEAKERNYEVAKKEVRKLKKAVQINNIRNQKGNAKVDKALKSGDRSIPKIVLKGLKTKGESVHAQVKSRLNKLKDKAQEDMNKNKVTKSKKAFVDLKTTSKRGVIIKISNEKLEINNKTLINDLDFSISYGDRVSLSGINGSGKTIFAKELMKPEHYINPDAKVLYLSQKYENIDYNKTVFENIETLGIGYEDLRKILANYLFMTEDDLAKKAKDLSGGEIARLAMAKITTFEIDLLILDEPTNNLDISTIEILIDALNDFKGALLVISHNRNFLSKIGIQKEFKIEGKSLS